MKPSLVVNSSPLIALVAALPDFDQLAGIVGRFIVPAGVIAELVAGGLKDDTAGPRNLCIASLAIAPGA